MPLAGGLWLEIRRSKDEMIRAEAGGTHLEAPERSSSWCLIRAGLTQNALPYSQPSQARQSISFLTLGNCFFTMRGCGVGGAGSECKRGRGANWHSCHLVGTAHNPIGGFSHLNLTTILLRGVTILHFRDSETTHREEK